jgi:hypothetical protein
MLDESRSIEGERSPRFRAFTLDRDGHAHECVFECAELAGLEGFKPRIDKRYKWRVDGHWMTASEFEAWKEKQK